MKILQAAAWLLAGTTFHGAALATPAGDPARGEKLHAQQCVACHARIVGGDGSRMYTRPDHKIKNLRALGQQVAFCSTQVNAGWFEDEEADVTAYLAHTYYKFK